MQESRVLGVPSIVEGGGAEGARPEPDAPGEDTSRRKRKHVIQFCGGMGSLVGEALDDRLRCHPSRTTSMRLGAVDTCMGDNRLFPRWRRSPWLLPYVLGQAVSNFDAVFSANESGWTRDLPLRFLASKDGIPGCNLTLSGVNKQPVIAAALNAMEAESLRSWLERVDGSFDPADRTLLSYNREASYVAGTGGTGLTSALFHAGWRSQADPSLFQRLIIIGPELYPTAGDTERERRHKIVLASLARTIDRICLIGTDPLHPHFGGLLPGFAENLEPKSLRQVVLVEGSNGHQTLSFDDAQRMVADYLYYLSQVPELAALLAVQMGEGLEKTLHAARRTPFVWGSISFHVCELWRSLPRVATLQRRAAVLGRMQSGVVGSGDSELQNLFREANTRRLSDAWERRMLEAVARERAVPIFDRNALRTSLADRPEQTASDAVDAIRSVPDVVDRLLSADFIAEVSSKTFASLHQAILEALPNVGVERVFGELTSARVSLGAGGDEAQPMERFLTPLVEQGIHEAAQRIQAAKEEYGRAMRRRPGLIGQFFPGVVGRIREELEEAAGELREATALALEQVNRVANAVLRNTLNAKVEALRGRYRSGLEELIRLFEGARDELAAEGARSSARIERVIGEGRSERSATRLSLFPDEETLRRVAYVDDGSVASAFAEMFSMDGAGALRRTERPIDEVGSTTVAAGVPFAPLVLSHPDAKSFIADNLREAEPFVRVNERGLQGLSAVTRRAFLVYPKELSAFVETLPIDRNVVHRIMADVPAVFVLKQIDTLPSSAIQSLCAYDNTLQAALAADAREQDGVVETLISFPFARYRRAPRVLDAETARHHRRAAAALVLNPLVRPLAPSKETEAEEKPEEEKAAWARFSLLAKDGGRVPILGGDEAMHSECPLFQGTAGIWHIRFVTHQGVARERSLGTHVLPYALDIVAQHGRYQAAIRAWIERCAKAGGPEVAESLAEALQLFESWCEDAEDEMRNEPPSDDATVRGRRSRFAEVLPTAAMVCGLAQEFAAPEEWYLDFGVTYQNQRLFPGAAAGAASAS